MIVPLKIPNLSNSKFLYSVGGLLADGVLFELDQYLMSTRYDIKTFWKECTDIRYLLLVSKILRVDKQNVVELTCAVSKLIITDALDRYMLVDPVESLLMKKVQTNIEACFSVLYRYLSFFQLEKDRLYIDRDYQLLVASAISCYSIIMFAQDRGYTIGQHYGEEDMSLEGFDFGVAFYCAFIACKIAIEMGFKTQVMYLLKSLIDVDGMDLAVSIPPAPQAAAKKVINKPVIPAAPNAVKRKAPKSFEGVEFDNVDIPVQDNGIN